MPEKKADKEPPVKSRWQDLKARESALANLPEVGQGSYIIAWLDEMDWHSIGGMGSPIPLSWSDIDAWARVTKTEITSDEALLLRHLSKLYVSKYSESKNPATPAPYSDIESVDTDHVSKQLLVWAESFKPSKL